MDAGLPSRTAIRVALRRAAHQLYDAPIVFEDPIAVPLLGAEFREELERTRFKRNKPSSLGMRAFLVARSRFAEDHLATAVANGVRQYVLLGAGLDTFAYRNPFAGLRVFEVDHPSTQAWKRGLLSRNSIAIPGSLRYVSVDFEQQSLEQELTAAGFDSEAPTFFAWLGVVPYLTLEAFQRTLAYLGARPAGSGLVMDYGLRTEALPPLEQLERASLSARVALAGEPFQLFFLPEELKQELHAFAQLEDVGSSELNARYFADRQDELRMRGESGRILCAWRR
ncbi:class I SAM-dependent methyltransferase [Silvibacterium dinghuense]|uniref:S-adenosyl-L-methionine-dependent methyltransferase n=1 Tax=Silvibacterium dinghuense TaxID=1560006 RepID=A0A4Q1SBC8_9BACT|nr:class I SAM-dependent methyltransferase [Silvibacterium dinghuense]RXS94307.1 SAM-dependent methyltransferase [Silvibacterium dinghuense]GGH17039.1 S-adenosyl-L-methionine-dependent methyltransferase [Silvibacterium dinghuense]